MDQYCVKDFPVFAISHQIGLGGNDGILGLSPKSAYSAPQMIYTKMEADRITSSQEFSMYIANSTLTSSILFGAADETKKRKGAKTYEYDLINHDYWTIGVFDVSYGDLSFFLGETNDAIIDSGTSLIAIPRLDFDILINMIGEIDETLVYDEKNGAYLYPKPCQEVWEVQGSLWI
jgi:hypothetical protein